MLQLAKISCKNEGIIKVIFKPEEKKEKAERIYCHPTYTKTNIKGSAQAEGKW